VKLHRRQDDRSPRDRELSELTEQIESGREEAKVAWMKFDGLRKQVAESDGVDKALEAQAAAAHAKYEQFADKLQAEEDHPCQQGRSMTYRSSDVY